MRVELRNKDDYEVSVILCHKQIETELATYYIHPFEKNKKNIKDMSEVCINKVLDNLSLLTEKDKKILEAKRELSLAEMGIKNSKEKLKELGEIDSEDADDHEDDDE